MWGSKGAMPLDRIAPVPPGAMKAKVRRDGKLHMTGKPTDLMRQAVRICEAGGRMVFCSLVSASPTGIFRSSWKGSSVGLRGWYGPASC